MKNIEVEIRSFISEKKYRELLKFFSENTKKIDQNNQETHYLNTDLDLRIQKSDNYSKIWLKTGKIHDEIRKELEIKFKNDDFSKLQEIFDLLGYKTKIKWIRNRNEFKWKGINICLDFTKGYGYIIELESLTDLKNKEEELKKLKLMMKELKIKETPREKFEEKFNFYEKNWERLI